MRNNGVPLWFASSQCFGSHLEISNNGIEQGVPVFYDNSSIEAFAFNNGTCGTNGKPIWSSVFLKPRKEQTITIGLTSITIIAHIKQDIKMFTKENIENGKNRLFYLCIMWRTLLVQFLYDKLKSIAASHRLFRFKRNQIVNSEIGSKYKISIRGIGHLVWRLLINQFKGQLNHNVTTVPVNPIAFHSSAMRFSAFLFISSERLKRAKASSYVTFLISIILSYLFFAAKIRIISEKANKNNIF